MIRRNDITQFIKRIAEEPYRVFFPLGILFGAVGATHWFFYSVGWIPAYSGLFHSTVQTQGYLGCFVIGFLLTAMPRFASAPPATSGELAGFLLWTFGIFGFSVFGLTVFSELCFIGWLLGLARFAVRRVLRVKKSGESHSPPVEFVWIPVAILHGLVGALLVIASEMKWMGSWSVGVGKPMAEQGFLLAVVTGVGGFLAPRLMGRFQVLKPSEVCSVEKSLQIRKRRVVIHLLAGLLLFTSFWLEGFSWFAAGYGLRALVVTGELFWTCSLIFPPRVSDFYAKLLWVSLWMTALGNWAVLVFPKQRTALLHLVFLGGFSLMTFAMATVVTLSHSGEAPKLHRPLPVLRIVLAGISTALGLRLLAPFFPDAYFRLLGAASLGWLLAGGGWLFFALPRLFRFPDKEEFERFHDEAKRRISNLGNPPFTSERGR